VIVFTSLFEYLCTKLNWKLVIITVWTLYLLFMYSFLFLYNLCYNLRFGFENSSVKNNYISNKIYFTCYCIIFIVGFAKIYVIATDEFDFRIQRINFMSNYFIRFKQ